MVWNRRHPGTDRSRASPGTPVAIYQPILKQKTAVTTHDRWIGGLHTISDFTMRVNDAAGFLGCEILEGQRAAIVGLLRH